MTTWAERITADRKARNLSRAKYAALVGLTPTQINNLEHGRELKEGEEAKLLTVLNGSDPAGVTEPAEHKPDAETHSTAQPTGERLVAKPFGWDRESASHPDDVAAQYPTDEVVTWQCGMCPKAFDDPVALRAHQTEHFESAWVDIVFEEFDDDEDDIDWVDVYEVQPVDEPMPEPEVAPMPQGRYLSNSELATWMRCRRKWWLSWHRHMNLKRQRPAGARAIGTWVHEALARKYVPDGQISEDPRAALESVLTKVYTTVNEYITALGVEDDLALQSHAEMLVNDFKKDADLARAMIDGYVQWIGETGADEGLTIIGPEQVIWAPMDVTHSEQVYIVGKLDARVYRDQDRTRFFIDHKTVGNLTSPVKVIHQNPQMLHYMLLEQLQGDDPDSHVGGALYNMLRKVKRSEKANPPFYHRVEVRHNRHEVENHKLHIRSTISDLLDVQRKLTVLGDNLGDAHHALAPPTSREDCAWSCDFFAVCSLFDDGSRAEDMLAQYYEAGRHLDYYGLVDEDEDD